MIQPVEVAAIINANAAALCRGPSAASCRTSTKRTTQGRTSGKLPKTRWKFEGGSLHQQIQMGGGAARRRPSRDMRRTQLRSCRKGLALRRLGTCRRGRCPLPPARCDLCGSCWFDLRRVHSRCRGQHRSVVTVHRQWRLGLQLARGAGRACMSRRAAASNRSDDASADDAATARVRLPQAHLSASSTGERVFCGCCRQ